MICVLRELTAVGVLCACLVGASGRAAARTSDFALHLAAAQGSQEKSEEQGHELLYKIINFALLVAALAYLGRKPLGAFFASRSESIRKGLEEGRKALESSETQLRSVEEKLARLEEEIAAFKDSAAKEMEAERQRMRQAAATDAEKVLASARAQIESSLRAAKLELKSYAAQRAVEVAEELIRQRLDDAGKKRLMAQFVAGLDRKN